MNITDTMFSLEPIRSEPGTNLWVFNNTPNLKGVRQQQKNSIIHLVIKVGDERTLVKIPTTWIPLNIGLQAPKKAIFESPDFLRAINNGYIRPITNKEAQTFYQENDEASAEYDLVNAKMNKTGMKDDDDDGMDEGAKTKPRDFQQSISDGEIEETALNPKIIQAVGKFTAGEIKDSEFNSIVRNIQAELTDEDLEYVISNVKEPGIHRLINKVRNG
jgi:hypothetical protein